MKQGFTHVHTQATHKLLSEIGGCFSTPCCVWSGAPGAGTVRRASRSADWASSPRPDNFTIPALAGGVNHIRVCWQETLNSAPVPVRVWYPAVSPEHAADGTMQRFVFPLFIVPACILEGYLHHWGQNQGYLLQWLLLFDHYELYKLQYLPKSVFMVNVFVFLMLDIVISCNTHYLNVHRIASNFTCRIEC